MRVASLLPSATEHLFFIGAGGALVGRSHECDFPPQAAGVPTLTSARTNPDAPPAMIDQAVRAQLSGGSSLYALDSALLARLRPDLILTQDLCRVCSIDLQTVRAVADGLSPPPRILALNPQTFEDVLDDVLRVGEAVGRPGAAAAAVVRLRERFYRAADCVNPYQDGPSVAVLEWTDPLFIAGHWSRSWSSGPAGGIPSTRPAPRRTPGRPPVHRPQAGARDHPSRSPSSN